MRIKYLVVFEGSDVVREDFLKVKIVLDKSASFAGIGLAHGGVFTHRLKNMQG